MGRRRSAWTRTLTRLAGPACVFWLLCGCAADGQGGGSAADDRAQVARAVRPTGLAFLVIDCDADGDRATTKIGALAAN